MAARDHHFVATIQNIKCFESNMKIIAIVPTTTDSRIESKKKIEGKQVKRDDKIKCKPAKSKTMSNLTIWSPLDL